MRNLIQGINTVQNDIASLTGVPAIYTHHSPAGTMFGWLWKVGLIIAVMLAAPAAIGAPTPAETRQQGALAFNFTSAANQTATLSVAGDGSKNVVVEDADESTALTLSITGRADENDIELRVSAERDVTLTLNYESGETVTAALTAQPDGAAMHVEVDADGGFTVAVTDATGDRVGVSFGMTAAEASSSISITWDDLPAEENTDSEGRITPRFPGFLNEDALGGSVTLGATGATSESAMILSLFYADADVENLDETELRVHRFENSTGAFEPVGSNQRGIGAAGGAVGDFGVDGDGNAAWCVTDQLGTFAVGVTDDTLPAIVEDDDLGGNGLGGSTGGICGAVGTVGLVPMLLGLVAMRPRRVR